MKKILVLVVLLLSSCILVKDFGVYWDKGIIDPLLEGKWKMISEDKTHPILSEGGDLTFIKDTDSYLLTMKDKNGSASYPARSITLGNYTYLMVKDFSKVEKSGYRGYLIRYKTNGSTLNFFAAPDFAEMMNEKYSDNLHNIDIASSEVPILDEKTATILSEIPEEKWVSIPPKLHYEKAN